MEKERGLKAYVRVNMIPVIWEILFIISCFLVNEEDYIYTNFIFYFGLLVYFVWRKELSFKNWKASLMSGKKFWIAVVITALGLIVAFVGTGILENTFSNIDAGTIGLKRDTWGKLIIFAISTIILPPIVEELFYRKSLIYFDDKKIFWVSVIVSIFLYAWEHNLTPFGIFLASLWGIPFTIAYIKTKNIYVSMTAHLIVNFLANGADVVITAVSRL